MGKIPTETQVVFQPSCLVFFIDETGQETFADPNYPVFGYGGCAMMSSHLEIEIRAPWRAMKARHFGGSDVSLHACDSRRWTNVQKTAIAEFFRTGRFMRFGSVIHNNAKLPASVSPIQLAATSLLIRFEHLTARWVPRPQEVAFVHEASQRGDPLLERNIGKLTLKADGGEIPVRQFLQAKSAGDPALEVADCIVNAAGGQALHWSRAKIEFRKDFQAVFRDVPEYLQSFSCIDAAAVNQQDPIEA